MALLGPKTRSALHRFEQDPLVRDVHVSWDGVHVRFRSGITEHWAFDHGRPRRLMFPRDRWWVHRPEIRQEHGDLVLLDPAEYDPGGPMWGVTWREIVRAGFLDRRLLLHRMLDRFIREKWTEPRTPRHRLDWDLERLLKSDNARHIVTPGYVLQHVNRRRHLPPGFAVASSLAAWGKHAEPGRPSLQSSFQDPRRLFWGLESCLARKRDVTRLGLIHAMTAGRAFGHPSKVGPRLVLPSFWKAIMEGLLHLKRPVVLDLSGCPGFAAAAVVALGGVYIHDAKWPIREGAASWAARHGATLLPDAGGTADVALMGDMRRSPYEELVRKMENANERCGAVLATVDRDVGVRFRQTHTHADVIRLRTYPFAQDSALLMWHQS